MEVNCLIQQAKKTNQIRIGMTFQKLTKLKGWSLFLKLRHCAI